MAPCFTLQESTTALILVGIHILFLIVQCTHDQHKVIAITGEKGNKTLWYNSTEVTVASFELSFCEIAKCKIKRGCPGGKCENWMEAHMCKEGTQYICVTDDYWGKTCKDWGAVGWNTGGDWGYKPQSALDRKDHRGQSLKSRMTITKRPCDLGRNQIVITIENPGEYDEGMYIIGTYGGAAEDYRTPFWIRDMEGPYGRTTNVFLQKVPAYRGIVARANPSYEDKLAIETGYEATNAWVEWMKYSAASQNMSNCLVCGMARSSLLAVPFPAAPDSAPTSLFGCLMTLFQNKTSADNKCEPVTKEYHAVKPYKPPSGALVNANTDLLCIYRADQNAPKVGNFTYGWCNKTYSGITNTGSHKVAVSDVYWFCGDKKVRAYLPQGWEGECAVIKFIQPFLVVPWETFDRVHEAKVENYEGFWKPTRAKREAPKGSLDNRVYLDATGVPRGVPDEFKARNQIWAGLESIIPQITVNKNVDWINYIYCNQQRFVNYTRDAFKGVAEQLDASSIMAFQNRMALDMILAEKGGVCKMVGAACCTYIPNNTSPGGSITRALHKIEALSAELKENSGVDTSFFTWLGDWKSFLTQVGVILGIVILLLSLITCCVVPLIKSTMSQMAVRAVRTTRGEVLGMENDSHLENQPDNKPVNYENSVM
ncbi:uncharacterized protein [Engystomops pustulosus]|uniref:uncharacterized protein isoform X1 n=1 Tax=Engystomops pustulosus TaxID=76066 RepID=UPI003AFB7E76